MRSAPTKLAIFLSDEATEPNFSQVSEITLNFDSCFQTLAKSSK
jgi:hypothetical protein